MFSERTARYVTDWVGNWQRINIKSQSECYYYWVYCCTHIAVLAVYLYRWRQNATYHQLSFTDGRYISFHMWLWLGIELENSTTKCTRILLRKFTQQTSGLIDTLWIFFRGSYPQKPCAIGKDLTVFIKEIGVSRYIGNPARFNFL